MRGLRALSRSGAAAIFCLVGLVSCGDGGSGDPVASVAVDVDRSTVSLGAPAQLSFRFVAFPSHEPLSEDYRVMVHFVDADGEMMWAADHDPPVPTSEWQPGQTITYTRRIRIPMYPYIGDAVVEVGLYSAVTGQRLPLDGEDLGQRAYRGLTLKLEPQSESSFLMYQDGWHDDELNPESGERWRWTGATASLSFRNPRTDATLYLEIDGRADLFETPQLVSIRVGEDVVYEAPLESIDRQFLEIELTREQLGGDDLVTASIAVDRTFVPAEVSGALPGDDRALGIRVFYAFLEPHAPSR